MTGSADSAASTAAFHEMVLAVTPDCSRGLIAGLIIGSGAGGQAYTDLEDDLAKPSLGSRLRELVGLQAAASRVIVDDQIRQLLHRHARRLESETGARIIAERQVQSGHFAFSYRAYTRPHAQEIRGLLGSLPSGVQLADHRAEEKVDPRAAGVEAYTPAHEYELKGEGRLRGRIDQIIEARRPLAAHPFVQVERIELDYA
jgi:hypothetical protein